MLRYIFFHHQTTTNFAVSNIKDSCVISSFITKPQLVVLTRKAENSCVISSFITKPQLGLSYSSSRTGCVISSFITKPQLRPCYGFDGVSCVISSFITKPQLQGSDYDVFIVALYLLSSPNHNICPTKHLA